MKKMKRNILSAILVVLTAALASCSDTMDNFEPVAQETMNVNLTVAIPDYTPVTRAGISGTEGISTNDMQLLCFDKDGIFVGLANATVGGFTVSDVKTGTEAGDAKSVTATVPGSTARIHFVANQSISATDAATYMGMNENTLMMQLESNSTDRNDKIKYWGYVMKDDAAAMKEFLGKDNTVYMLRDRAKVTAQAESGSNVTVEGVVVYNSYDHGTVAPLDKNSLTFQPTDNANSWSNSFNFITLPKESTTITGSENDLSTSAAYAFEHANTTEAPLIVIIKVKHSGNQEKYHKILLQDSEYKNYTIKRNHEYRIVISQLAAKLGYDSFDGAVNGTASNNRWTKVEDIIPAVSDNTCTLSITGGTYIVLNKGASERQSIEFTYTGDDEMSAENFSATFTSNKGVSSDNNITLSYNNGTGTISYNLIAPTSELQTATIELQDKKHGLMRRIHLYSIDAFQFVSPTFPTTMGTGESATTKLKLTVPDNYPDELLPVEVRIASPDINPQDCDVEVGSTADVDSGAGWNCWFVKKIYKKGEEVSITLKNVRKKNNGDTGQYWVKAQYFGIGEGNASAATKYTITYN